MIIQCEQCRTKFKLDDEKVSDRGVKVRCAKCRHVFTVRKSVADQSDATMQPAVPAPAPTFAASDETVVMSATTAAAPTNFAAEPEVAFDFGSSAATASVDSSFDLGQTDAGTAPTPSFDFGEVSFADVTTDSTPPAAAPAWGDETVVMAPPQKPEPTAALGIDFGTVVPQAADAGLTQEISFDFGEARVSSAQAQNINFDFTSKPKAVAAVSGGDVDFGSFDFGDVSVAQPAPAAGGSDFGFSFDAASPAVAASSDGFDLSGVDFGTAAESAVTQKPATAAQDFDFSGMDFGSAAPAAATQHAPAPAGDFDFSGMDFGTAAPAATPTPAAPHAPAAEAPLDSFSLGDIDFGADAAPVAVSAAQPATSEAMFSFSEQPVPPAAAAAIPAAQPVSSQPPAQEFSFQPAPQQEETPPLSIASRRRQSPMLSAVFGLVAILVIGALGFMGYLFLGDSGKAAKFFGKPAPVEEGKISIQNVNAYFLTKTAAGELLVITGEAVNNYKKPRAALQVKGVVFSATNEQLITKTAYAGNQLTREQLATMPKEKIEAAMNNQFGDSLSNLEVQPGKSITFTIVVIDPPATAKDYGVEPLGSTVAASGGK